MQIIFGFYTFGVKIGTIIANVSFHFLTSQTSEISYKCKCTSNQNSDGKRPQEIQAASLYMKLLPPPISSRDSICPHPSDFLVFINPYFHRWFSGYNSMLTDYNS